MKHHPSIPCICIKCGCEFLEIPSRIARGKGKFCSILCYRGTPEEQFWNKVDKSGNCWIWIGSKMGRYGHVKRNGHNIYAHRLSWQLHNGPIPNELQVLHTCDTPLCIRPSFVPRNPIRQHERLHS
jgi:hypothetical protein